MKDTITIALRSMLLLWSDGIVDLRGTTFWKNSWLKVAVAIAAIVAGTYSDYKEFIYFQF
jgi:hypothetical protein